MLATKNLTKIFGRRVVVDKINLEIKQGEIVGLLGPNGAGKTTTFNTGT
jgi:ABC-type multidrug transport system ATPase subunit